MFARGGDVMTHLSWSAPVQSGLLGLAVVLYWFISLAAIMVIFMVYISSSVVTNFVVAFGPLFIACYFFPFTRKFFDGWLSCVVAGMLTQIFAVGWLALFITSLQGMMQTMTDGITASAGPAVNDVATQVFMLILAGFLVSIFSAMTTISALLAIRISGGVHASLANITAPARDLSPSYNHGNSPSSDGYGAAGSGSPNPSGEPTGLAPSGSSRAYAFQRSVGSAP